MTDTTNRNFKGIWIPAAMWMSKEFTSQEKIMLAEIDSLDNSKGCFATNAYFADFFGLSERRVREIISSLAEKGAVTTKQTQHRRIIRVANSLRSGWRESAKQGGEKVPPYNKEEYIKEDISEEEVSEVSEPKQSKPSPPKKKESVQPTIDQVIEWALAWGAKHDRGLVPVERVAREAFQYYERLNWEDRDGKSVKNWKNKIAGVWFSDQKLEAAANKPTDGPDLKGYGL